MDPRPLTEKQSYPPTWKAELGQMSEGNKGPSLVAPKKTKSSLHGWPCYTPSPQLGLQSFPGPAPPGSSSPMSALPPPCSPAMSISYCGPAGTAYKAMGFKATGLGSCCACCLGCPAATCAQTTFICPDPGLPVPPLLAGLPSPRSDPSPSSLPTAVPSRAVPPRRQGFYIPAADTASGS